MCDYDIVSSGKEIDKCQFWVFFIHKKAWVLVGLSVL